MPDQSLLEIWTGLARSTVVDRLAEGDFAVGCEPCGVEISVEGRASSYPALFDRFDGLVEASGSRSLTWPTRIEFNLSNSCNLMCVQCSGSFSSMIRAHREHLPPLPKAYDERFFADLEHFIPHLSEAQFAGGEPFLARENFRVWEMLEQLNPDVICTVVTNATQWNERIEELGRSLRMGYTLSIDGLTRETYEQIRVNSDYDTVMANLDRFVELAVANERAVEVNFCLMPQNLHEFGELLLWAESKNIKVNVSVVRYPEASSVAAMDSDRLAAASNTLQAQDESVRPHLTLNQRTWITELNRIGQWARAAPSTQRRLWWSEDWQQSDVGVALRANVSTLGLRVVDDETPDIGAERERFAQRHPGVAVIHEISVDYDRERKEADHLVTGTTSAITELLGSSCEDAHGRTLAGVMECIDEHFGAVEQRHIRDSSGSRMEVETVHERAVVHSWSLARRNAEGVMTAATVLAAVEPR